MSITNTEFRRTLARFASGVTVVTTKAADGHLHGLTVSAFCSVSLNPPLILVCIEKKTGSRHAFSESKAFVVNILQENQADVSSRFASHSDDKFSGLDYMLGEDEIPILQNCAANLECRLVNSYDGGDHMIFVGEVIKTHIFEGEPLIYFQGHYRTLHRDYET